MSAINDFCVVSAVRYSCLFWTPLTTHAHFSTVALRQMAVSIFTAKVRRDRKPNEEVMRAAENEEEEQQQWRYLVVWQVASRRFGGKRDTFFSYYYFLFVP